LCILGYAERALLFASLDGGAIFDHGRDTVTPGDLEQIEPAGKSLSVLAKNAVANLSRLGASWLVVLLLPPLLVRELDKPSYATWVLILQIGAYVSIFDGGVQGAVARFVARYQAAKDVVRVAEILSSTAVLLLLSAVLAGALTIVAAWELPSLFRDIPSAIAPSAREALVIVGLSIALALPFSVFAGFFLGLQKNELIAIAATAGKFIGAAGTAWAVYHHHGFPAMAAWTAVGNILPGILYAYFWKRAGSASYLGRGRVKRAAIKEFLSFFFANLVTIFGSILVSGLDLPIVTAFAFSSAAYYAVATTISNMLIVPFGAIVSTIMPVTSGLSADVSPERMGSALLRTSRYAMALLSLIALPILAGMRLFLGVWVGSGYVVQVWPLAQVLVIAQCIRLCMMPFAIVAFSVGQQQRTLISPLVEGIVNLSISLVAVRYLGALGVALGTLVGAVFGTLLHLFVSLPLVDAVALSKRMLAFNGILKPASCVIPAVVLLLILRPFAATAGLQLTSIAVCELVALLCLWKWNFTEEERQEFLRFMRPSSKPPNSQLAR
jgi:O-antigen/teichoic acid export membrane protein